MPKLFRVGDRDIIKPAIGDPASQAGLTISPFEMAVNDGRAFFSIQSVVSLSSAPLQFVVYPPAITATQKKRIHTNAIFGGAGQCRIRLWNNIGLLSGTEKTPTNRRFEMQASKPSILADGGLQWGGSTPLGDPLIDLYFGVAGGRYNLSGATGADTNDILILFPNQTYVAQLSGTDTTAATAELSWYELEDAYPVDEVVSVEHASQSPIQWK